jgi:hypothetical protein
MFLTIIFLVLALFVLVLGIVRVAATRRRARQYDELGDDGYPSP